MRSSWIRMETWCCGWGATPSIRVPAWTTTSFAEAVPAESATAATAANSANFIEISPSSFASFRSEALHAILHPIGGRWAGGSDGGPRCGSTILNHEPHEQHERGLRPQEEVIAKRTNEGEPRSRLRGEERSEAQPSPACSCGS